MEYPVYYSPAEQRYYTEIFTSGEYTNFIEKSLEEYLNKKTLWSIGKIHKNTFRRLVNHNFLYIKNMEVDDNYVAHYMLLEQNEK